MLNKELFRKDPTTFSIPNDGVTVVTDPQTPQEWDVLRFELSSFVCEGEYQRGLERVLSTFLEHLNQPKQPAVWVSGFYGSGKSHLVRVLQYLWNDVTFPDGATARGITRVTNDIQSLLEKLTKASEHHGGLWAAAGKLSAGTNNIQLAVLRILFRSAGLPVYYAPAKLSIWLKQKGLYEKVQAGVESRGANFQEELHNLYVSSELAESLLEAIPDWAKDLDEISRRLELQFPSKEEISNDELVDTMEAVLRLQSQNTGKIPLTLLIFDELQQSIGDESDRALDVQEMVEACSTRFGSQVLFVGTGQAALEATPQLSKLQDRFTVRVSLEDKDVEQVVREVILRKQPDKVPILQSVLDQASGEISRHLAGTKIAPTQADHSDWVPDYPLLPTRRRFWERVLRAIDRAGTAAQLRTQLRVVHEATKGVAEQPVGTVVGGDMIYDQQKSAMLQSGVLLREVYNIIEEMKDGTAEGTLRARLAALIFLINELPTEGVAATGVRATADALADLLIEDLPGGSASLRRQIPELLADLVENGTLMLVDDEYRLQTRESAEWQRDYRGRRSRILADDARLANDRTTAFRVAIQQQLKNLRIVHGQSKTPRKYLLHFGESAPPTETDAIPIWVLDEWTVSAKGVRQEAREAGTESPIVFVLLPRQDADELKHALAGKAAAQETLDARPSTLSTPEGMEARRAMETQAALESNRVQAIVAGILANARVYLGGGVDVTEESLVSSVERAIYAALERLFPRFQMVDQPGWGAVVKKAQQGAPDPLSALGFTGNPDQHPACKEIRNFIGAHKTGREIRQHFGGVGYGWPQDAIDGALLALVVGGYVRAEKNGQILPARQIGQSQIGAMEFFNEERIITAKERLQVRKLAQDMGLTVKSGEEMEAIPRLLQRLEDLAADAGGPPPLPEPPSTATILELQSLIGNEQFLAVYERRVDLLASYKAWSQAKAQKEERLPRWQKLQRLLEHASALPTVDKIRRQVNAIEQNRSLLDDPDPMKPLLEALTTELRSALQAARQRVVDVRERELRAMETTAEWSKLDDAQWRRIFDANHVGPIDALDIGDDDKLLAALDAKPLSAWETEAVAVPTRMRKAREQAAKLLEPKAVQVRPKRTTLHTVEEVDAYLAELRAEILSHIDAGKPVIL